MKGLIEKELLDEAEELFLQMEKSGCPSDSVMLNAIVRSLFKKGELSKAIDSIYKIEERCFSLEVSTTSLLTDLFSKGGKYHEHINLLPIFSQYGTKLNDDTSSELLVTSISNNELKDEIFK